MKKREYFFCQKILDIINQAKTSPEALERSFSVLDEFYNLLSSSKNFPAYN